VLGFGAGEVFLVALAEADCVADRAGVGFDQEAHKSR